MSLSLYSFFRFRLLKKTSFSVSDCQRNQLFRFRLSKKPAFQIQIVKETSFSYSYSDCQRNQSEHATDLVPAIKVRCVQHGTVGTLATEIACCRSRSGSVASLHNQRSVTSECSLQTPPSVTLKCNSETRWRITLKCN